MSRVALPAFRSILPASFLGTHTLDRISLAPRKPNNTNQRLEAMFSDTIVHHPNPCKSLQDMLELTKPRIATVISEPQKFSDGLVTFLNGLTIKWLSVSLDAKTGIYSASVEISGLTERDPYIPCIQGYLSVLLAKKAKVFMPTDEDPSDFKYTISTKYNYKD